MSNTKEQKSGWDDMAEACALLKKYGKGSRWPFHCEHDVLYVCDDVDPSKVDEADKERLKALGFIVADSGDQFISFRFGSCQDRAHPKAPIYQEPDVGPVNIPRGAHANEGLHPHRYGYVLLDEAGEVAKVVDRTNPIAQVGPWS